MTYEMMIATIEALGDDAILFKDSNNVLHVDLNDFEGLDEHWSEIEREYDNEDAVDAFVEMLEREALSVTGDYYRDFQFNGFVVRLGYTSFDI